MHRRIVLLACGGALALAGCHSHYPHSHPEPEVRVEFGHYHGPHFHDHHYDHHHFHDHWEYRSSETRVESPTLRVDPKVEPGVKVDPKLGGRGGLLPGL